MKMVRKRVALDAGVVALLGALLFSISSCNLAEEIEERIITISGKVSHDGSSVKGALVLLVEVTDVSEGLSLANAMITDSNGKFTILDVQPGTYYVLAIDDANGNLQFDAESDRLGFYGVDPSKSDLKPDAITVSDQDITGADIVDLYTLP